MGRGEDFNRYYEAAKELGFDRGFAAEFIPSAGEVQPGQDKLAVAFSRLSKANEWVGPHVRSLQNGGGRPTRSPAP